MNGSFTPLSVGSYGGEMGKLYGIGVGPGDWELMTLKAVRLIKECDIIVVPRSGKDVNVAYTIAKGAVAEMDSLRIEEISMPMTRDRDELEKSHREAVQKIMGWLDEGKNIAFLTLGDPTIYSTYAYVHGKIRDKGYETEIIPGIPSFCAVAARLNESLTEAGEALVVIPGSYQGVEEALAIKGTKVLMKSGKAMGSIKRYLKNMEKPPTVKMVERCGMEGERIFHTIEELDENASYFSLMIVRDK